MALVDSGVDAHFSNLDGIIFPRQPFVYVCVRVLVPVCMGVLNEIMPNYTIY